MQALAQEARIRAAVFKAAVATLPISSALIAMVPALVGVLVATSRLMYFLYSLSLVLFLGVIGGGVWAVMRWVRGKYNRFVRHNANGFVKRGRFQAALAGLILEGCVDGGFEGVAAEGVVDPAAPPVPPRPVPMRNVAVAAGQELRVVLRCPRYTPADWKVAVERAGKYFDENQAQRNWRPSHKVMFVNVCAASILTPSDSEIEAKEALCSTVLLDRRNRALDARIVVMPWYLRLFALLTGRDGFVRVGAESPKVVA
jgi:hypothetical protein